MSTHREKVVLAIDPGSSKCGLALVKRNENSEIELLWRKIVPCAELENAVHEAQTLHPFSLVIVGSGTKSSPTVNAIREAMPGLGILVVDERDTTMQARERYWEYNRRRGWKKLFPATLFAPKEPIDDFAALILAERVLVE